jgi:hypothetical protein
MKSKPTPIDLEKLRARVRRGGFEQTYYMLDEALGMFTQSQLHHLAKRYVSLEDLTMDPASVVPDRLLDAVTRFHRASLSGEYYESFEVNGRNSERKSAGTLAWIATHGRLLDRCLKEASKGIPAEVREAMDLLFALLDRIDEGHDDIVFFADEGGAWQVGVDWPRVLPTWFKLLAATVEPVDYAQRIVALLSNHHGSCRDRMLAVAHRIASKDQRAAVRATIGR